MVNIKDLKWDFSNPHILKFTIKESDIDILGHVNNKVYLNWCELVSWDHSAKLGITPDVYKKYQCACVVIRSENNFSGSLFICLLYTSPSPRDGLLSRMPSSA